MTSPTHLNSPSLPSLLSRESDADKEREKEKEREKALEAEREQEKRMEELGKELEKEREAKVKASNEKAALEAEIESLSQALFEEVRIMSLTVSLDYFLLRRALVSSPLFMYSIHIYFNSIASNSILTSRIFLSYRPTKW